MIHRDLFICASIDFGSTQILFVFLITTLPHPYQTKTMACKRRRRKTSLSSAADDAAAQSTTSSPAPDQQPQTKKEKFEDRYKM